MTEPKPSAKRGRPPLPAGEAKTARVEVRLTPAYKADFVEFGGVVWLERQIEDERKRLAEAPSRR